MKKIFSDYHFTELCVSSIYVRKAGSKKIKNVTYDYPSGFYTRYVNCDGIIIVHLPTKSVVKVFDEQGYGHWWAFRAEDFIDRKRRRVSL